MIVWKKWMWLAGQSTRLERNYRRSQSRRFLTTYKSSSIVGNKIETLQRRRFPAFLTSKDFLLLTCPRCGLTTLPQIQTAPSINYFGSLGSENMLQKRDLNTVPPQQDNDEFSSGDVDSVADEFSFRNSIINREVDQDLDDQLSHLRIKLYSAEEDTCGTLSKLYEAASIQEVFDIIEDVPQVSSKFASQALVTLWDIQKLLFRLGPMFKPEAEFFEKIEFIKRIKNHPIFVERIVRPVVDNVTELQDEPLCASLLCLKKMNFDLIEIEPLIDECIRRKNTLSLSGASRLSVCLRSENLYGTSIMSSFMPLTLKYIDTMNTDMEVRLVSILLKNSSRLLTTEIINKYIKKIESVMENKEFVLESITYSKIFLALNDFGSDAYPLIRKIGVLLATEVPAMDLMDLLLLQKFLIAPPQEPYPLIDALLKKNLRLIEEEHFPRLDLLSSVAPHLRNIQQRKKMAQTAKEFMDDKSNGSYFESVIHVMHGIVKGARTNDKELYDQFWNAVLASVDNNSDFKRLVTLSKNYLNFSHGMLFSYRNLWLESVFKKHAYTHLDNCCKNRPGIFVPSDFAGLMAFLIAFDQHFVDLHYLSKLNDFISNMKIMDIYFLAKGVDSAMTNVFSRKKSKNYDLVIQICNILEEECGFRLMQNASNLRNNELITVCRMVMITSKVKGDSPLFDMAMKNLLQNGFHHSREVREACSVLNNGNHYFPKAMELISEFVFNNLEYISPETVERFLALSFTVGWENEELPFEKLSEFVEIHSEKFGLGIIHGAIALAYHRQLKPELINSIFNVEFLDRIEEELSASYGNSAYYSMKFRIALMELNRTVCLDVPDAHLPWFHEKFCQNLIAAGRPKSGYLYNEVFRVLCDLLGGENAVLSNVCSPKDYYYPIDFVLEFDKEDRPIRRKRKRLSLFRDLKENVPEVKRKVAILLLPKSSFTKTVRNLNGSSKLKQRHLEMLGYHVVKIDPYHWNSMYMSENLAKQNYLESQIFR